MIISKILIIIIIIIIIIQANSLVSDTIGFISSCLQPLAIWGERHKLKGPMLTVLCWHPTMRGSYCSVSTHLCRLRPNWSDLIRSEKTQLLPYLDCLSFFKVLKFSGHLFRAWAHSLNSLRFRVQPHFLFIMVPVV